MILTPGIDEKQKTVVIVGCQRGGTSMVAGVARELGIFLGTNLGANHEDPKFLPLDTDKIETVVRTRNEQHDVWGWKMPHSSEYIVDFQKRLRNPHVIVVFRNPLAMAESQMKRSSAHFADAFKFSSNRLIQISDVLTRLDCPALAVNYEKALTDPKQFIAEMIEFLHITPNEQQIESAIRIIDPIAGYQRIGKENWRYTVKKSSDVPVANRVPLKWARVDKKLFAENNVLKKTDDGAFVEFSKVGDDIYSELVIEMVRVGAADSVRVVVNTGNGFSKNMSENIRLYMGLNTIKIKSENIDSIRIFPSFEGITSNVKLFRLFEK